MTERRPETSDVKTLECKYNSNAQLTKDSTTIEYEKKKLEPKCCLNKLYGALTKKTNDERSFPCLSSWLSLRIESIVFVICGIIIAVAGNVMLVTLFSNNKLENASPSIDTYDKIPDVNFDNFSSITFSERITTNMSRKFVSDTKVLTDVATSGNTTADQVIFLR